MRGMIVSAALAAGIVTVAKPSVAQVNTLQKPRVLGGIVTDGAGAPLAGAIVYLKNTATLAIKTYESDAKGAFHFGQLGTDADYQVWAMYQQRKSGVKTISAIENKPEFNIELKIK